MLKFFVADQCTKRHNKNPQPTCLDVFDKKLHALLHSVHYALHLNLNLFTLYYTLNTVHHTPYIYTKCCICITSH